MPVRVVVNGYCRSEAGCIMSSTEVQHYGQACAYSRHQNPARHRSNASGSTEDGVHCYTWQTWVPYLLDYMYVVLAHKSTLVSVALYGRAIGSRR